MVEKNYPKEYVKYDYEKYPQDQGAEMFGTLQDVGQKQNQDTKGRRGLLDELNINTVDKRPKCLSIGAQLDCRYTLILLC